MWYLDKAILISNNDKALQKYEGLLTTMREESYEAVLLRSRDMLHRGCKLLTHPQASSLKPNQTPIRSILLYPGDKQDNSGDVLLMEKCLEVFYSWQAIAPTPGDYAPRVLEDFMTIDLSLIDAAAERL